MATNRSVAIVAMGSSRNEYVAARLLGDPPEIVTGDVWTINMAGEAIVSDMIFMMDPMWDHPLGQRVYRAAHKTGTPIMTSKAYPEYPLLREFPLKAVAEELKGVYFNTTVAYALAYALYNKYTNIGLFGCDFTYPDRHFGEAGRGCVEFWIGRATAVGVNVMVASSSQLLDCAQQQPLYGYWKQKEAPPDDQYGVGLLRYPEFEEMQKAAAETAAPYLPLKPKRALPPVTEGQSLKLVSGDRA